MVLKEAALWLHVPMTDSLVSWSYRLKGMSWPFKYFALNIFREISLILNTTLEVFTASCSDWSTRWEKTTCFHFLYEAICTQPVRLVLAIYKLFVFAPFGWLVNDLLYRLSTWPHTIWVIAIWWQVTVSRTL